MTQPFSRRKALSLIGGGMVAAALPVTTLRAQGKEPLRLGFQDSIWGAVAIVADAEKMFEKAGAPVVVKRFDSGRAAADALIAGSIDIVTIGATPFVVRVAKSNLMGVATVAYAGGTLAVVASKKSGIKTVADLKGKKVASQLGSSTDNIFQNKIAPAAGLKKGDFQVVNVKFRDHVSAMASGSVDAFAGVEPYPSLAETEGFGTVLTDYSKFDIVPVMLGVNRPVMESRQQDMEKFMRGWLQAVKVFRDTPKKAAHIIGESYRGKGFTLKDEVFERALARMDVTPDYKPELKAYLNGQAKLLKSKGQINELPNWDRELDTKLMQKVGKV